MALTCEQMQAQLAALETAAQNIALGVSVVEVDTPGVGRVRYTPASSSELNRRMHYLRDQIAANCDSTQTGLRRVLYPVAS
jgi:hypothetical protein